VLIVDDDPKVCETLDRYLSHAGYATASALDGKRALEAVRTFAPDLVVLDVMLPEIDGLEICRSLRETSSVPIIMLTARSTERTSSRAWRTARTITSPSPSAPANSSRASKVSSGAQSQPLRQS
jgi:DNA-binding response OmpR family regulator